MVIELFTILSIFNYFNIHTEILDYITRAEYDNLLIPSKKEQNEIQAWLDILNPEYLLNIITIQNNINIEEYDIHVKLWWQTHYYKLEYFNRIKNIVTFYKNIKTKKINKAMNIINKRIVSSMWDTKTKLGKHMFNYRLIKDKLDKHFV